MPPSLGSRITDDQVEAHEDRLQRLEREHSDINSQLAEHSVRVDYMAKAIENGFRDFSDKVSELVTKMDTVLDTVGNNSGRINRIEAVEEKRYKRAQETRDNWKKVGIGVAIAVCGVAGKSIWDLVWSILTR